MHDPDDDNAPSVDIEVLEDLGRLRRERDALQSIRARESHGDDESAESLTESQRSEILEQTLAAHSQQRLGRTRVVPGWRPFVSHGLVAAAAAGLVFMLVGPGTPEIDVGPAPGDEFDLVAVLGTTTTSHLASEENEGSCLEEDAQVRIYRKLGQKIGGEPDLSAELEVWIHAKPESGSGHWKQHLVEGDAWQRQANGDVFFEGPLSSLAPLSSGDWTLDFQIGPRGACGPDLDPSCRKLPTVAFRVASAVDCDETR